MQAPYREIQAYMLLQVGAKDAYLASPCCSLAVTRVPRSFVDSCFSEAGMKGQCFHVLAIRALLQWCYICQETPSFTLNLKTLCKSVLIASTQSAAYLYHALRSFAVCQKCDSGQDSLRLTHTRSVFSLFLADVMLFMLTRLNTHNV
jgi:hypothetical protein